MHTLQPQPQQTASCHRHQHVTQHQMLKQRCLHSSRTVLSSTSKHNSSSRRASQVRAAPEPSSTSPTAAPASSVLLTKRGPFTWGSCVSTKPNIQHAVDTAAANIQAEWAKQQQQQQAGQQQTGQQQQQQQQAFQPDLAIVFASCNYGSQLQDMVKAVRRAAPSVKHIFGCSVSA